MSYYKTGRRARGAGAGDGSGEGEAPYYPLKDYDIYNPDGAVSEEAGSPAVGRPIKIVKDVILVRSHKQGLEGYMDAIGNPALPMKLRRRSLLGLLTCDPTLNVSAVAVLEVTPLEED